MVFDGLDADFSDFGGEPPAHLDNLFLRYAVLHEQIHHVVGTDDGASVLDGQLRGVAHVVERPMGNQNQIDALKGIAFDMDVFIVVHIRIDQDMKVFAGHDIKACVCQKLEFVFHDGNLSPSYSMVQIWCGRCRTGRMRVDRGRELSD